AAVRRRRRGSVRWWGPALPLAAAGVLPPAFLGDGDTTAALLSGGAALVTAALLVRPCARWCAAPMRREPSPAAAHT
ncbi:MAG: hypothetical protein H5T83_13445, partial [Actinotalea sp.]|nr:hypothetical protein [Actinotalea sp.]